ncbi:MAG: hypothetical protein ACK5LN_07300 [Propioniciclava sp.]
MPRTHLTPLGTTHLSCDRLLAGPATISAFRGITEPAMYGLNLKYGRLFITASLGGAVGGLLTGLFNVNMYGFTGALVGFPSFINPAGADHSFTGDLFASAATLAVSFGLTYFLGFDDADLEAGRTVKKVRLGRREPVAAGDAWHPPMVTQPAHTHEAPQQARIDGSGQRSSSEGRPLVAASPAHLDL